MQYNLLGPRTAIGNSCRYHNLAPMAGYTNLLRVKRASTCNTARKCSTSHRPSQASRHFLLRGLIWLRHGGRACGWTARGHSARTRTCVYGPPVWLCTCTGMLHGDARAPCDGIHIYVCMHRGCAAVPSEVTARTDRSCLCAHIGLPGSAPLGSTLSAGTTRASGWRPPTCDLQLQMQVRSSGSLQR